MSDKGRAFEEPDPGSSYLHQPGMPPDGTRPTEAAVDSYGPNPNSLGSYQGPTSLGHQQGPNSNSLGCGLSSMEPYSTMMGDGLEGYCYQFEPHLETKYECPICLMCLREPIQTECGHRFCRSCITRSLRDAGRRCPIDNSPLTEQRFFPDVCVKREILDLKAHCSFKGCPEIVELRSMEQHQDECAFGTLICPMNCGAVIRRKSVDTHLGKQCPKRRSECGHCQAAVPRDQLQIHTDGCPKVPTQCDHCGEPMLREKLNLHVKTECPAVVVDCRYRSVGCNQKMERKLMAEHLQTGMQLHMDLLASKMDLMNIPGASPMQQHSQYDPGEKDYFAANANPSMGYSKDVMYDKGHRLSQGDTIAREKYWAQHSDPGTHEKSRGANSMSGSMVGSSMGGKMTGLQRNSSTMSEIGDLEMEVSTLKEKVHHLQRNIVQQNQDILMLKANAERHQQDAQQDAKKFTELNESFKGLESRLCNGEFYWRLMGYTDMVREAQRGETSVRHSKGFYTSFYGYKLCLRVNINVSESSHSSHVSLFVHFLKGDYDDLLDWPFSGKITLTIMDQNAESSKRKHISETLLSKPDLAAFHRPRTNRNHKGFGYMEFAPVSMLDTGTFIKDDCLLIRVLVEVKKS